MSPKCKCEDTLKHIKEDIINNQTALKKAWEDGGYYAREVMHNLTLRTEKHLSKTYKRCGCFYGQKLSRIKTLVDPYKKNLPKIQDEGGEYFVRMTKHGVYTEIIQIISE